MAPVGREDDDRGDQGQSDNDWNLIRRVGLGDQAALEQLYKQYYGGLYRFILQITRRVDYVEEVINDVMFVVWEKAAGVVPLSKASTWILGIAHNKALQALRRNRSPSGVALDEDDHTEHRPDKDVSFGELETKEVLFALMRRLSPEQRAVLELVYYHGLHYAEIAQVIDCPENTVKTRVFHARRKLREIWPDLTGTRAPDVNEIDRR
jgi:RNA polymerase sigma factor (sigma-70 family)